MTVLQFNKFYDDKHAVDEAVKQHAANNAYEPQHVPDLPLDGVEYVSTRQMALACAVLFVAIVAVSFLPISA